MMACSSPRGRLSSGVGIPRDSGDSTDKKKKKVRFLEPGPVSQVVEISRIPIQPATISKNQSVSIADPKFAVAETISFTRNVGKYIVLRHECPFEIIMIRYSDRDRCFVLSGGFEDMQDICNELKLKEKSRPRRLMKNKIYATFDSRSLKWHRCRLLNFDEDTGKGQIYYFDYYLHVEDLQLDDLREMPEEIDKYPVVPTMRGHLYDVVPQDGSQSWGQDARDWFRRNFNKTTFVTVEQKFQKWIGLQMTWTTGTVNGGDIGADILIDVGMVLFEDTAQVWEGTSLNWRMVRSGFGKSIGLGSTYFTNLFFHDVEPMFSYADCKEATVPEWCTDHPFPYFAASRLPQISFRYIRGPDCIYVYLVNKIPDMVAMEKKIEEYIQRCPPMHPDRVQPKMPVLFKRTTKSKVSFVRAVVLKIIDENVAEILLVDYGVKVQAARDKLHPMPERLVKIPSFVHRIHLSNVHQIWPQGLDIVKWFACHRDGLRKLIVKIYAEWKSVCFAVRPNPKGSENINSLGEIHEGLSYNMSTKKWLGDTIRSGETFNFRELPLLESHFFSFGVDIHFVRSDSVNVGDANEGGKSSLDLWKVESLSQLIADDETFEARLIPQHDIDKKAFYEALVGHVKDTP